jgi:hypothetical protein
MPPPVFIRKSLLSYISSLTTAAIGILAICFAAFSSLNIILKLVFSFILLLFIVSTIKKIVQRKVHIAITEKGISVLDGGFVSWKEIKDVFIDTRSLDITVRGGRQRLTYLNIEPVFSGQFSKQRTLKSIVISDMEIPPAIILHHIRSFQHWYNLSKPKA